MKLHDFLYKIQYIPFNCPLRKKDSSMVLQNSQRFDLRTFWYINQAKGSPNYIQLWRTQKRFFIFLWKTIKGSSSLHLWRMPWWLTIKSSSRVKRWRTLNSSSRSYQEPIMVLHNKRLNGFAHRSSKMREIFPLLHKLLWSVPCPV